MESFKLEQDSAHSFVRHDIFKSDRLPTNLPSNRFERRGTSEDVLPNISLVNNATEHEHSSGTVLSEQQQKTPLEKKGWQKVGSHYEKTVPLPGDWNSMTEDERAQWQQAQRTQDLEDFGIGPGGPPRGRTEDPMTGERGWFGYAGQEPSKEDLDWMSHGPKVSL